MRAVIYRSTGDPDVIEIADVPRPEPGPFEVRVKVEAAALNPTDAGAWGGVFGPPEEQNGLGWDVAGTVDAVGLGAYFAVGDRVIAIHHGAVGFTKGQAEYVVVPSHAVAPAPAGVDAAHAATLPLNGLTAAQSVDLLGPVPTGTLLVTGAAGAVGGFAVQLAKRLGWTVVGSDQAADQTFVTADLGADDFIAAGVDIRDRYPDGVDALLDTAALGDRVIGAVRDGGTFVTTRVDLVPLAQRGIRIRVTAIGPDAGRLTLLSDLAASGALTLRVAGTYPLDDARQAHARLVQGGLRGRLVLIP